MTGTELGARLLNGAGTLKPTGWTPPESGRASSLWLARQLSRDAENVPESLKGLI